MSAILLSGVLRVGMAIYWIEEFEVEEVAVQL